MKLRTNLQEVAAELEIELGWAPAGGSSNKPLVHLHMYSALAATGIVGEGSRPVLDPRFRVPLGGGVGIVHFF